MRNRPTPLTTLCVGTKLREMTRNMTAFRGVAYQMLAHPDTTPEQLKALRDTVVRMETSLRDVKKALAAKGYDPNLLI